MKPSTGHKVSENLFDKIFFRIPSTFALHLQGKKSTEAQSYLHIRPKMVNSHQKIKIYTCNFLFKKEFGEIGTGLTCDSQYFEIYDFQYIEILCIYSKYTYNLLFALPKKFGVVDILFITILMYL